MLCRRPISDRLTLSFQRSSTKLNRGLRSRGLGGLDEHAQRATACDAISASQQDLDPASLCGCAARQAMDMDPSPSEADVRLTRRLAEGARIFQINMLDHVIAGQSFAGR